MQTFFEKSLHKVLHETKKIVPLHPLSRGKDVNLTC